MLQLITGKYTFHLRGEEYVSRNTEVLQSHMATHEAPPFLFTSNVELRVSLEPIAREHKLNLGDLLDVDDGRQFAYQVQGLFPSTFQ